MPDALAPTSRLLNKNEFASAQHGIYTRTLARPDLSKRSPFANVLPDVSSWPERARAVSERTPRLATFAGELRRANGVAFWGLLGANVVLGCLPAAELYFARALTDIASQVGIGLPLSVNLFAFVLAGRVCTALTTELLSRAISTLELSLLSSLSLRIQSLVLSLHLSLPRAILALPSTQRKLSALSDLSSASSYRRVFNPLAPVSLLNSVLSVGLGTAMLYKTLNPVNAACLVISVGSLLLDEEGAGWERQGAEHLDVTNDAYLRFQAIFKLGTSKSLRREVHTLGLVVPRPLSPLSIARSLSHTIATTTFILYSAFLRPQSLICNFAELAIVESAVWRIRCDWQACQRGTREVEEGLEKLEFLYEDWPERDGVLQGKTYEQGPMEIEFRRVSLVYEGSETPALKDVSFTIKKGEMVVLVGHNGSGKTSVVSLLAQEVRPTKGTILVNGRPIEEWEQTSLARGLSFAFQSSPFLPFTVRELLTLGQAIPPATLDRALLISGAQQVVDSLEDGLDSYVTSSAASASMSGSGGRGPAEYFALAQVVPREMDTPRLEWVDGKEARQRRRRSAWAEEEDWENVEMAALGGKLGAQGELNAVEEDKEKSASKRKAERSTTDYPIFTRGGAEDGLEGNVIFTNHAPVPFALSGGQWQRLQLCRSLLSPHHATLIWDEPFASLDPLIESSISHHVAKDLKGERTVLMVTHRFGVTREADRVLVMDGGSLVEQGTHEELMRGGGSYRELWEVQAEGFVDVQLP